MVPLGIGMAATVRVGHAVGRSDAAGVKRAGMVAMWLGIVHRRHPDRGRDPAALCHRAILPWRRPRARRCRRHRLAATLLVIGATFFITDGLQTIAAGALRGMNDTRMPLLFAAVSYWGIGFCSAYALGLPHDARRVGRLDRPVARHAVYATLLILRFRRLAKRLTLK